VYRQSKALNFWGKGFSGRLLAGFLAFLLAFSAGGGRPVSAANAAGGDVAAFRAVVNAYGNQYKYDNYLADHAHAPRPNKTYLLEAADYARVQGMEAEVLTNFQGQDGRSLWTDEDGLVEYTFNVDEAGLYNMSVLYFSIRGKNSDILRSIFLDGNLPFVEASGIELRRVWVNELPYIQEDNRGNQLRPVQVEEHRWMQVPIEDPQGSYAEPFLFYLSQGSHTLTIVSQREPVVLRHIMFHQLPEAPSYQQYAAQYGDKPRPTGVNNVIQGQDATRKSSPMLYPTTDNSSPAVTPYSASRLKINNIGGGNWASAGQWIEWEFEVPADGLYKIGANVKQNFARGTSTFRRVFIDGAVPFAEMSAVPFSFRNSWRVEMLGGNSDPYLFYLTAGKHTLRMEVVLGEYAQFMREMTETVLNLNNLYRQIIMVTGNSPDAFRDYQINRRLPHLRPELMREQIKLQNMFERLVELSGGRGDRDAVIRTNATLLGQMHTKIEEVPQRLGLFKTNIGALSTWMMLVREMNLAVESVYVLSADQPLPRINDGFFAKLWHELATLFFSFIIDYNAIGNVSTDRNAKNITVWVGTGRDQANTIKALIDENFTVNTGINVNLMLADVGTLLQATLAGQGPDVAMTIGSDLPMNYGMRGAAVNLAEFPDFEEVSQRFLPSIMLPYRFRDNVFALPETQTFNMLFYRRDILHELGIDPPRTWQDVKDSLSVLSKNHMEFGIPVEGGIVGAVAGSSIMSTFAMFSYQAGGQFYGEDGAYSELDSDINIATFREFTRYFTDYRQPRFYDFANRFRNGEMPMAIANYTTYNTLSVFAPEIRGLWAFTVVPGTPQPDGTIDHSVSTGGEACIMLSRARDRESAWAYMKWWTSGDTQTRYGFGMEALMGPAARYASANQDAFHRLPWPVNDFNNLLAQFEWAKGIPEVPGGYFTPRQLNNAFYRVVEDSGGAAAGRTGQAVGPREALTDFTRLINEEITYKRIEFGLDVRERER